MVSKNNRQLYQQKAADQKQRWGVRKLSVGVASVLLGTTFLLHSNHAVSANTVASDTTPSTTAQADSKDTVTQGSEHTLRSGAATPTATAGVEKDTTVTPVQPADNAAKQNNQQAANADTQTNTAQPADKAAATSTNKASDQTTTPAQPAKPAVVQKNVKPVAAPATTTTSPDPTTPDKSIDTAIINDKDSLTKNWLETPNERAQVYITVKGTDQKIYVSSYADFKKRLYSEIYTNRMDPNSLELHIEYQVLKDRVQNFIVNWGDWLRLDTSRIGKDSLTFTTDTGEKVAYTLTPGWGKYKTYDEWLSEGQDMSKINALKIGNNLKAGTNFALTVPLKYIGRTDGTKQFNNVQVVDYGQPNANMGFDFIELHPAQIETPAKPTTDKATTTTVVYNNPLLTASDWHKMAHGQVIAYYTAKGKDGKTYVTGYVTANNKSESIINVDQIDPNTLEYHLIYHNGDKEVGSGLWFNFADNKTVAIDTSRLGANGPQLKSQQGWSYGWGINGTGDGGNYYSGWAEYLKAHNGSGDKATQISMTGTAFKPDDTIEFVIPVKYIGQLSDRIHSLTFAPQVNDYGGGNFANGIKLYFTTVRKDLSEVKQVVLLPTEFMGEQPGQSDWKLVKEISKDMPNGWDALKISNFPTYKGSFNMDSLPKGDLPSVVYGSAQYFIDLSKIQEIFANHGYTVKYANNNGKAQEMPFYAYVTLPLAKRVDDDRPVLDDPSIWVIQVQAVPAIILNKDQHYVADPNAKPWDTTSMIDEIYAADDAGQRKTRDQLEKLPKTDVDISYEYQAPGAATAVAVDKVDLTKAGVYTVTYSHTYADGQVVKDSRKVYVDDVKQETKDITRTIIVHTPNGTDQTVIQKATLTREVILDATTGEIKSAGKWSTAKWETYSAPEFKGYTPDVAQVEEATVTKDTQDTTVEINYTANKPTTPEQNNDQGQKPQTNDQGQKPQTVEQVTKTGKDNVTVNTRSQAPAPVAQSAQAQKLPHTGEAENRLGILGVLTATLGMLGLGWKKRERQ